MQSVYADLSMLRRILSDPLLQDDHERIRQWVLLGGATDRQRRRRVPRWEHAYDHGRGPGAVAYADPLHDEPAQYPKYRVLRPLRLGKLLGAGRLYSVSVVSGRILGPI